MLLNDDAGTARAGELHDRTEVVAVTGGGGEGGAGLELELRLAKLAGESSIGRLVGGSLTLRERKDLVLTELVGVLLSVLLGVGRKDGEDGLLVLLEDLEGLLGEGREDDERGRVAGPSEGLRTLTATVDATEEPREGEEHLAESRIRVGVEVLRDAVKLSGAEEGSEGEVARLLRVESGGDTVKGLGTARGKRMSDGLKEKLE
jgi:hypothetical protein